MTTEFVKAVPDVAWEKAWRPDMSKVNVNGGAIALGHRWAAPALS